MVDRGTLGFALTTGGAVLSLLEEYSLRGTVISVKAEFGYSNYLPAAFWAGFFILLAGVCLVISSGKSMLNMPTLALLAVVIWGLPVFASELPTHDDAFWHMGTTEWLTQMHGLDLSSVYTYTRLAYLQYPAFFVLFAVLLAVTHLDPMLVLKIYPLCITIFLTLAFYVVSRRILQTENLAFAATVMALFIDVGMSSNHFSPSATAQVFFVLILFLTVWALKSPRKEPTTLLIVFLATLTLLHPVVALFYICFLGALALVSHPLFNLGRMSESNRGFLTNALLIAGTLFVVWNTFLVSIGLIAIVQAFTTFGSILYRYQEPSLTTEILQRQTLISPVAGWIRRMIFLGPVLPACVLSIRNLMRRHLSTIDTIFLATLLFWFVTSLVTEESDRILSWMIPFAVLLLVMKHKESLWTARFPRFLGSRTVLGPILVATIFLTFVSYYAGAGVYVTTKAEAAGMGYLIANTQNSTLYSNPLFNGGGLIYDLNFFNDPVRDFKSSFHMDRANVVFFSQILLNSEYFATGQERNPYSLFFIETNDDARFNRVYSNGDFTMFSR